MKCDLIIAALSNLQCEETADGTRVLTHCLYPNFEQVAVYVQTHLDGFLVHDGGGCFDLAFDHGFNPSIVKGLMRDHAALYGADSDDHRIFSRARTPDWLPNVVMSVANASAATANAQVISATDDRFEDREFKERTYQALRDAFHEDHVPRRIKRRGRTGKMYTFAFGVTFRDRVALVDTVTPNSISIASRFTSFSAVGGRNSGGAFLAFNRPLATEDSALLSEVADVLPLSALVSSIERNFKIESSIH